jgi:tyrosinase
MLMLLEANLQRVLDDTEFGLPYWDWAADGDRPVARQPQSRIWGDDCMGGDGAGRRSEVASGPFGARSGFRVRADMDSSGRLLAAERPLRRRFRAAAGFGLPRRADVARCLTLRPYDDAPWDGNAAGFRNALEGWLPSASAPNLHNRVHVWIGGDMGLGTSPNDPVFFLNHCNVDRIWAAWQERHPTLRYRPPDSAPQELFRHRNSDPLHAFFTDEGQNPVRPRDVLRVSSVYTYDVLPTQ